ncbi:MAG TPA: hypothetical protein VFK37_04425 [Bacillales bacterium]|nr:hypothetical protein [Bacillales bacterium]
MERISSDELTEWAAYFKILNKEQEEAEKEANRKAKSGRNGRLGTN